LICNNRCFIRICWHSNL